MPNIKHAKPEAAISLLETAMILVPMLIFIMGVVGIIDFIQTGNIISRTLDEKIRSLNGKPYSFVSGAIIFNRVKVELELTRIINAAQTSLIEDICRESEPECAGAISLQAAIQVISINTTNGNVSSVANPETKTEWQKGNVASFNITEAFDNFRANSPSLSLPSGVFGSVFLPSTVLVSLTIAYAYPASTFTQQAFTLVGAGAAKHMASEVIMLRGDIE